MYIICSMLTKKQKNLLLFINKTIRSTGVSPSYEEMKNALNLKSKSGIHRLISALEERGFIKRLAHKARALEVLKLPETASANDIYNSFSPSVIKGGLDSDATKKNVNEIIKSFSKNKNCEVLVLSTLEKSSISKVKAKSVFSSKKFRAFSRPLSINIVFSNARMQFVSKSFRNLYISFLNTFSLCLSYSDTSK